MLRLQKEELDKLVLLENTYFRKKLSNRIKKILFQYQFIIRIPKKNIEKQLINRLLRFNHSI